jgi:HD superfamily phosphohydrolase
VSDDKPQLRRTTIITDPVHQVMDLGSEPKDRQAFRDVVDTRVFQRLRRISQLGLASYVFPGATHSRFSHSLGVYYLAYTVLRHLSEASSEETEEINSLALEVKLCGLLHDVGHGPFSHSFEDVLKSIRQITDPPLHEDWTAAIIQAENSEVHQALQRNGLNANRMASVFSKNHGDEFPRYLKQIISSQIDVDRMDYLVRDSHFAGVAVGKFDIQYLINSLAVIRHGDGGPKTLGVTPKGVKAYEAFAVARQFMNRTVYYHRKVKVLEYMMERFIRETLMHSDPLTHSPEVGSLIPSYFRAVANVIQDSQHYDKQEFLSSNLCHYIELTEDSVWTLLGAVARSVADLGSAELARTLAHRLLIRQVLPHYVIEPGKMRLLSRRLTDAGFVSDEDFAIVKLKTTTYKGGDEENVFVEDVDGEIDEILAHSEMITLLRDKPEEETLLVVIREEKRVEIEETAKNMQAISSGNRANRKRSKRASIRGFG